jgi:hypothetical protein
MRNYVVWLIMGICTCGLAGLLYVYYNFDDVRKLENLKLAQGQTQYYGHRTTDPAVGLIVYFVCGPITTILKYNTLNTYYSLYGDKNGPKPPEAVTIILTGVGMIVGLIFGIIFPPLFIAFFGLLIYIFVLENNWQNALNYQIQTFHQTY